MSIVGRCTDARLPALWEDSGMRLIAVLLVVAGCAAPKAVPPASPPPPRPASTPAEGAPWSGGAVQLGAVDQAYLTEWQRARNKDRCPLLIATDLGGVGGTTLHRADFGEG